jgi:hypothetical protein
MIPVLIVGASQHWLRGVSCFVNGDVLLAQKDIVDYANGVQQVLPQRGIEFPRMSLRVERQLKTRQVGGGGQSGVRLDGVPQPADHVLGDLDGPQLPGHRVAAEDAAESARDHHRDARALQGPDR